MSTPLSGNKLANALLTKPQFDEFVAARMADPLQPAIERMPDSLQAVIDRDIARDCALWGVEFDKFVFDPAKSKKNKSEAIQSTPLKARNAHASMPFAWEGRQIEVRWQDDDSGFYATIDNLKDSIFKTTYLAAQKLLNDLTAQQKIKDTRQLQEQLEEIKDRFNQQLDQLETLANRSTDPQAALFTVAIAGGKKYQDILQDFKYELAQCLSKQELRQDVPNPIRPDMHHEWLLFLNQTELDILSSTKRNPKVVAFLANPGSQSGKPIYKVESVWPLSDISSLDRRGYSPANEQKYLISSIAKIVITTVQAIFYLLMNTIRAQPLTC